MNHLLECLFRNRGYDDSFLTDIEKCMHPVPTDTDKMCERLREIHDTGRHLVLLTDFDTDGLMSGVIGFAGLSELGFNVSLYFPDVNQGYGFQDTDIDKIKAQFPDVSAILTADVGITCYAGIRRGNELGIEMLVTDHHKPGEAAHGTDIKTGASVAVDPVRHADTSGFGGRCGAYVLWDVLSYYAAHETDKPSYYTSQIDRLRVFAGFGTMSDSMPLLYENRQLVRDAMSICRLVYSDGNPVFSNSIPGCDIYRRAFHGLYVMLSVLAEKKKTIFSDPEGPYEDTVSFYIAPLLNSIKRLGLSVGLAYGIFFGPEPKKDMETLYQANEDRKAKVQELLEEILESDQPYAPYVYITDADGGFRGLLAQQILSRQGGMNPVLVLREEDDGTYSGSGRSPSWYPFLNYAVSDLWYANGHQEAFGCGCDDERGLDALYDFLSVDVPKKRPDLSEIEWKPDYTVSMFNDGDAGLDIGMISEYLQQKTLCHPFGSGFPAPQGMLRVNLRGAEVKLLSNDEHVKLVLPKGVNVLIWHEGQRFKNHIHEVVPAQDDEAHLKPYMAVDDDVNPVLDLAGDFSWNYFRGMQTIQFMGGIVHEES